MSVAGVTVVLDRAFAVPSRAELQTAIAADEPAMAFLEVLTARGVRDLPTFAFVGIEGDSARILLRGAVVAIAHAGDGTTATIAADGVSTWTEVVQADCFEVEVRAAPGGSDDVITVISGSGRPAVDRGRTDAVVVQADADPPMPAEATAAYCAPSLAADETVLPTPEPVVPDEEETDPDSVADPGSGVGTSNDDVDLSHLFETSFVGVEAAAVRPEEAPAAPVVEPPPPLMPAIPRPDLSQLPPPEGLPVAAPPPPLISGVPGRVTPAPEPLGDHDGLTIGPGALAALRSEMVAAGGGTTALVSGARVQAVSCPSGHLNPPHADACRSCGSSIADRTVHVVARPSLGRLVFDSGLVSEIDRPLRIGRKPTTEGVAPTAEVPGLVVLPDPEGSLSRVHAEVRIEGWEVLLVDQDSTNGTLVELPGQAPVRLRPMDPCLLAPGSRITFADIAACRFETGPR